MKSVRKLCALVLCLTLLLCIPVCGLAAGEAGTYALTVRAGNRETVVRACDVSYRGNSYIALTDLSAALRGTAKQFRFAYGSTAADGEFFTVLTGQPGAAAPGRPGEEEPGPIALNLQRNRVFVDGTERRYYTHRSQRELYMSLTDIQLMLDIRAERLDETHLRLYPEESFAPDIAALQAEGYFDAFRGIVMGDADTGEILFSSAGDQVCSIASISKLMTYLLLKEGEQVGQVHRTDMVSISGKAAALSRSPDGMVALTEGASVPYTELVDAMLLASSNECALALAEHLADSEMVFVGKMNQRARAMGLNSARFYTPHGLPVYTSGAVSGKVQNRMSAEDLFALCRYILQNYPEICEITSQQYETMAVLNYTTANSNPLVFNMDNVTGLKTGSTTQAGYCLAASALVDADGETKTVVLVLLGAESPEARGQAAEILLRGAPALYAQKTGEKVTELLLSLMRRPRRSPVAVAVPSLCRPAFPESA